jgi:hypothetical protein
MAMKRTLLITLALIALVTARPEANKEFEKKALEARAEVWA